MTLQRTSIVGAPHTSQSSPVTVVDPLDALDGGPDNLSAPSTNPHPVLHQKPAQGPGRCIYKASSRLHRPMVAKKAGPRRAKDRADILERLANGVVLGDGGYLLELEHRGYVQAGPFTPEAVLDHPDAVLELHREFVDAGAEVLQALSFYASREKLATTGHGGQVRDINRQAVRLARRAARGHDVLVAGNLSLTWMYDPKDPKSEGRVRKLFDEQLKHQLAEGADFVIAETFSWLGEALLAAERIKKAGATAMVTMSFDKKPLSYDGHTPAECAHALHDANRLALQLGQK